MLPRPPSVRQRPAEVPPTTVTPIGVGIDTSRYTSDAPAGSVDPVNAFGLEPSPISGTEKRNG